MYYILISGPAGSGKSTLVKALGEWMEEHQMDAVRVNFDPAAEVLPYIPDVDVRRYVSARDLMTKHGLGPNGAMVASVDYLVNYVVDIRNEVEESRANYALVDLPGQLEVIAFRRLGPVIIKELVRGYKSAMVFLVDVRLAAEMSSALSITLLALSTLYRLELPLTLALNKIDLVTTNLSDPEELLAVLKNNVNLLKLLEDTHSCAELALSTVFVDPEISENLCRVVKDAFSEVIPLSAKEGYGIDSLYAATQRVLAGGEDFLTEEPSGFY